MPWARIDDGFDDHPKVLALLEHDDGAAAIGLWTLCLTWTHRNTRKKGKVPGRVPSSLPRRYLGALGRDAAKLLADVGLWDLAEDGWDIHDFDQYLPTAETSSARSEAGKRGAAARWGKREEAAAPDSYLPSADGKLPSGGMANDGNGMAADGSSMASGAFMPDESPPGATRTDLDGNLPLPDSNEPFSDGKPMASDGSRAPVRRAISKEIAPTPTPGSRTAGSPPESPPRAKAARGARIPDDFAVTPEMADWARAEVPALLAAGRGKSETDKFIDHWHQAAGPTSKKLDWIAAWRNWMRKANDELAAPRGRPPPGGGTVTQLTPRESTGTARARAASEAGHRVQALIDEGKLRP